MKRISPSTVVAITVALCGCAWIYMFAPVFVPALVEGVTSGDVYLFVLAFIGMLVSPISGIIAVYNGYRLFKAATKGNIKGAVGILAIFCVIFALPIFAADPDGHGVTPYLLLLTLIAIPLYVRLSRLLMTKAGLVPSRNEFIGRGIVLVVSVQIWSTISVLVPKFAPGRETYDRPSENPWLDIEIFGSIVIAFMFYKIAMGFIERNRDEQNDPPGKENAATSH